MTRAVWWIRRDLRLTDNEALSTAIQNADTVIPLFILDPIFDRSAFVGEKRRAFLHAGLRQLDTDLRVIGSRLIIREGDPIDILPAFLAETGASAVFAEADISPYAKRRDETVAKVIPLTLTGGLTVRPPDLIRKRDGDPYVVFTPFSKAWKALTPPRKADILPAPTGLGELPGIQSIDLPDKPTLPDAVPFIPGEAEAMRRLKAFTLGENPAVYRYDHERNLPGVEGTSRLSPYLRFGMISARRAAAATTHAIEAAPGSDARKSAETWLNELIWREFYISILHHFPRVMRGSFRERMDTIPWIDDPGGLAAWAEGRTGYPIVDAGMRQLLAQGWMHNRVRMLTASFLVKDLLIDWRLGERHFMEHLIDGDPASNNGGWQWTAGTGTDAAPYFRIFNPTTQSKKFDADGAYIRRWVPELRDVPAKYIHEPSTMPDSVQEETGCRIGVDYPAPIVNHKFARERTLAAYKQMK